MYPSKGEQNLNNFDLTHHHKLSNYHKDLSLIIQDYIVVSGHVDPLLQQRIAQGDYVDFSKLLLKDKILVEDEDQMELVVCNGKAYWTPVNDGVSISGFSKWEQAFRVFANIYTRAHLDRVGQLIDYNHIIHSIAQSFVWENVYAYDKDFRLHMARHPERNWSVILQQVWLMRLRDRVFWHDNHTPSKGHGNSKQTNHNGNTHKNGNPNDYCRQFNRGKCNLGKECAFEHRCMYCHKFGHGVIVCHKLIFDKDKAGKNSNGHAKKDSRDNHYSSGRD